MAHSNETLLVPNPSDVREMQIFETIPEHDRQAWLYFVHSSRTRETMGIKPAYTFDQFVKGRASHIEHAVGMVDTIVREGIGGVALIPGYEVEYVVQKASGEHTLSPMLGAFDASKDLFERERKKGPIALFVPHASLATPYLVARSLIHTFGEEIAHKIHIVVGPRPTTIEFEVYDPAKKQTLVFSPVLIGRILGNLALTGPDTDSIRTNEALGAWLKVLRKDFWMQLDEIMEPAEDGDNNIVIYCPAGRVAEDGKEFRVDGSFEYVTKYPHLKVWPIGAFDTLLQQADHPSSPVFIQPDASMWSVENEKHANWLHERAVILGQSPIGGLEFESRMAHNLRLTRQRLRRNTKGKAPPYLIE